MPVVRAISLGGVPATPKPRLPASAKPDATIPVTLSVVDASGAVLATASTTGRVSSKGVAIGDGSHKVQCGAAEADGLADRILIEPFGIFCPLYGGHRVTKDAHVTLDFSLGAGMLANFG